RNTAAGGWFPGQGGIALQFRGQQTDLRWWSGRGSEGCQSARIQASDVGHVIKVDELRQVAKFNSILSTHVLVLMVVVFAKFGEAHRGVSLLVERAVIATAQVTV